MDHIVALCVGVVGIVGARTKVHAKHYGKPIFFTLEELKQYNKKPMRFKQAREIKFMEGEVSHADQDFATIDHPAEGIQESYDLSSYGMGEQKHGKAPLPIRWLLGWSMRLHARSIYWQMTAVKKLWG